MIEFLVIAVAAATLLILWKSRLNYTSLPQLAISGSARAAALTVIIPARNEAHRIARAVESFPGFPVIVVDDGSADHTADVARGAGARVIPAPPMTGNQKGKPNACAEGAKYATTKWILFVDADTWFEPGFAAALTSYAEAEQVSFVTAFLDQVCESFFERALLPYAFALYFTGVSARAVNNAKSGEALANGQCMLFERAAYQSLGGHATVAESVIEDVALARHAKQQGTPARVIRAERWGHVRMYDSCAAIWCGFQKNSFRFLVMNPWSGMQVILASIVLTSWLPVLLLGFSDSAVMWPVPIPVTLLFLAPFLSLLPWYRDWRVIYAPLAIYLFQLIALNGMFTTLTRRKSLWKGRRV